MDCTLLTPRVLDWLRRRRPARVLHLFDNVCTLVDDDNDIISLATAGIGAGPFSMIVTDRFSQRLHPGLPIAVDPRTLALTIGPLTIEIGRARIWNPIPAWQAIRWEVLRDLPPPKPVPRLMAESLQQLLSGIASADEDRCFSAAGQLAGLGPGLTPAGDDILLGVLYALWAWHPRQQWLRLIVDTAVPRTTTLSAAFLHAAGDGEATIHWHNLVAQAPGAVDQILSIGATSGQDAWAGFIQAGRLFSGKNHDRQKRRLRVPD